MRAEDRDDHEHERDQQGEEGELPELGTRFQR
jgi:hypothetical protein